MKTFCVLILATLLTGCGWGDRVAASLAGQSITCIDGVKYIQFTSGASVKYTREGKIDTCGK